MNGWRSDIEIYILVVFRGQKERERDPRLLTLAPIVRIARGNRAFTYLQGKNAIRSLAYLSSSATLSPPFPLYFFRDFSHGFGDCDTSDNVNYVTHRGVNVACHAFASLSRRLRNVNGSFPSFLPSFLSSFPYISSTLIRRESRLILLVKNSD